MTACPICGETHDRSHNYCARCHAAYMREWRKTHPMSPDQRAKDNARSYANTYQRRGKLIPQPCELCGTLKAEKHHDDYSRPLDVRWLCRACHLALHKASEEASFLDIVRKHVTHGDTS